MKKTAITLGTISLLLSGCFGPGEPVVLPEDNIEAGRTCFIAQGLVLRQDKSEGDPVTYDELAQSMRYAFAAATQIEPFSPDNVVQILQDTDAVAEDLRSKDYAGAIPTCNERFGIDDVVELPEDDADAVISCTTMVAFLNGGVMAQSAEFGAEGERINTLFARLEERMESDPDVLVKLIGEDTEELMLAATKSAFAEAAPREYVNQCEARFPAE